VGGGWYEGTSNRGGNVDQRWERRPEKTLDIAYPSRDSTKVEDRAAAALLQRSSTELFQRTSTEQKWEARLHATAGRAEVSGEEHPRGQGSIGFDPQSRVDGGNAPNPVEAAYAVLLAQNALVASSGSAVAAAVQPAQPQRAAGELYAAACAPEGSSSSGAAKEFSSAGENYDHLWPQGFSGSGENYDHLWPQASSGSAVAEAVHPGLCMPAGAGVQMAPPTLPAQSLQLQVYAPGQATTVQDAQRQNEVYQEMIKREANAREAVQAAQLAINHKTEDELKLNI